MHTSFQLSQRLWSQMTIFVQIERKIVQNNIGVLLILPINNSMSIWSEHKWHFFIQKIENCIVFYCYLFIKYAEIPWVVVKSRIFNSDSNVFSYRSFAIENSTKNLFKVAYAPTWLVYRMHFKKIFLDWFAWNITMAR